MSTIAVTSAFRRVFAASPECVVRAPGRINLIGEHTDYNEGFVLPAAIDKAIWLAAGQRTDGRFAFFAQNSGEFFMTDDEKPVFQESYRWANYLLGVFSEARKDGLNVGGLNVAFAGDIPIGAGLSSSAALVGGTAILLNEIYRLGLSQAALIQLAWRAENHFVGVKCGIMDMFASIMGRANHFIRLDCRSLTYDYIVLDAPDYSLFLLDSGVRHALMDSAFNTRRAECEAGVAILSKYHPNLNSLRDVSLSFLNRHKKDLPAPIFRRCQFVLRENLRVEQACTALQNKDFRQLGKLMYQSHHGLHNDYEVGVEQTHFLVQQARQQGILGARQMGGGFGGCTINLLKTSQMNSFTEQTSAAYRRAFDADLQAYPVRLVAGAKCVASSSADDAGAFRGGSF